MNQLFKYLQTTVQKLFWIIPVSILLLISISCDKDVSVTPLDPEPSKGKILVNSTPENALIFVNGRNTGRYTPDSLTFYDDGIYNITLKKKYFKDTTFVVTLTEEETKEIFIDYLANPFMYGNLRLTSNPSGATIVLNDSTLAVKTPITLNNLLPGEYSVTIKFLNHRDVTLDAVVQSSNLSTYFSMLRDTSQWVDYQIFNSQIPSNSLRYITIDNNNIKWIGSSDRGLIRYDEIEFSFYSTSNSGIPGNIVNCISMSPDNNIWVGTTAGLGIFNGSSWITYNMNNSPLVSNMINSVEFDDQGNAWIGTSAGLFKFDGVNWKRYYDQQLGLWVSDTKITSDKIWIASGETGVIALSFTGDSLIYYSGTIYNYPTLKLSSCAIDNFGNVWFAHQPDSTLRSGISYYNGSSFTSYLIGSSNIAVNHIKTDNNNNKWISTYDGLLHFNNTNTSKLYSTLNSLISNNRVTCTAVDANGVVWMTTASGGLNKLKNY